jgi:hypothetical protein
MSDKLRMNVLVAARDEYSQQLINIILPHIRDIFQKSFDSIQNNKEVPSHKKFYKFQEFLKEVPKWNAVQIENDTEKILKDIPYLIDLVTAVFVTNVKILACVRIGGKSKNLNVNIPSKEKFIHKVIIECAESFYYDPLIFDTRGSHTAIQDKKYQLNKILDQSIRDSISKMLPISEILQEYLIGNLNDIDSASDGQDSAEDLEYNMSNDKPEVCEIDNDSSDDDEEDPDNTEEVVSDDDNDSSDDEHDASDDIKHVTMRDNKSNHFSTKPSAPLPPPPPLPSSDSKDLF